ncbi:unnamed protein product [Enterobius vermicularis]|uniref:Small conductance calcium-activated potassium channel protein n=1 Tax=Enterobius vermicularis TaxID=51028 RepID=A0A0N4UZ41_ENTVE|nr:unnamed protein product [Enterobius vermicularis]
MFLNYLGLHLENLRAESGSWSSGVLPKGEDETLPETPGATDMSYQEDTEKEGPIPTILALIPVRKKIKQRMITRWSRLYKKVHTRTRGRKE